MQFKESSTLELKQIIVQDIKKEVIAFANTKGGIIYVGIADDGSVNLHTEQGLVNVYQGRLRLAD